jgi:hypothetical protein
MRFNSGSFLDGAAGKSRLLCSRYRASESLSYDSGDPYEHTGTSSGYQPDSCVTQVFSPYDAVQLLYQSFRGLRAFLAGAQVVEEYRYVISFVILYPQFNRVLPTKEIKIKHLQLLSGRFQLSIQKIFQKARSKKLEENRFYSRC